MPQCINNIKEIKVQYKKTSESTWRTEPKTPKPTDTQITITGLDKDAEYEVRLVVVDVGGKSHMTQGADIARTGMSAYECTVLIGICIISTVCRYETRHTALETAAHW